MDTPIEIIRDAEISPNEIEDLRDAVGWETNAGKYAEALKWTYTHFSIKKDDKLIAFARVISDRILFAFIVELMVHPEFQHHGLGKQFLQHINSEVKKDGIKYIKLTFDPWLENFYKECGFEVIRAGFIKNYK